MKMLIFCPRWGSESLEPAEFVDRVTSAGYDGIELAVFDADPVVDDLIARARASDLLIITQHCDTFDRDLSAHLRKFEQRLRMAAAHRPLMINSHTGRDLFTLRENRAVFELAAKVSEETDVPIVHETHRGRCFHSAWRTVELLRSLPAVRIALDMSHWCAVSESLLEDQEDFIDAALPHVDHLHARVGWPQGPQVSDPRAPEWGAAVAAHLRVWDRVVESARARGLRRMSITVEFGPAPYLPALPFTRQPVADQWEINVHMMNMLRSRYSTAAF